MKKILYLVFVAIIAFTACSKKGNTPTPVATTVVVNGTTYPTVVIGSQTWTTVNYNGPGGENYNNSATNIPADGKLYTLDEAEAIVLPAGWRLPTTADYNQLLIGIGGVAENLGSLAYQAQALELMSTTGWTDNNGNNKLGFDAVPAGEYSEGASQFIYEGTAAFFLIDTPPDQNGIVNPLSLNFSGGQAQVNYYTSGPSSRMSVRFVKSN